MSYRYIYMRVLRLGGKICLMDELWAVCCDSWADRGMSLLNKELEYFKVQP